MTEVRMHGRRRSNSHLGRTNRRSILVFRDKQAGQEGSETSRAVNSQGGIICSSHFPRSHPAFSSCSEDNIVPSSLVKHQASHF